MLGIYRDRGARGGSIDPIDRKALKEWPVAKGDINGAKDGDLVRFDSVRSGHRLARRDDHDGRWRRDQQGVWYEGDAYNTVDFHFTLGYGDYEVCVDCPRHLRNGRRPDASTSSINDVTGPESASLAPVVNDHRRRPQRASGRRVSTVMDRDNWFPAIASVSLLPIPASSYAPGHRPHLPTMLSSTILIPDEPHATPPCDWTLENLPAVGDYYDVHAVPMDNSGNGGPPTSAGLQDRSACDHGHHADIVGQPDRLFGLEEPTPGLTPYADLQWSSGRTTTYGPTTPRRAPICSSGTWTAMALRRESAKRPP